MRVPARRRARPRRDREGARRRPRARAAAAATGTGVLVSLGGDIAVAGPARRRAAGRCVSPTTTRAALDGAGPVGRDPRGGLATSGTTVRRWRAGERRRCTTSSTRAPAGPPMTPWRTVTVAAATCVDANVASTAAIVLGEEAPAWLAARGLPARLVRDRRGRLTSAAGRRSSERDRSRPPPAEALWYLTRGTGVVALLLLTAGVVLGVARLDALARPALAALRRRGLHRNVTLLAIVFVAVHVVTTVADGFAPIGLLDAVVPFASPYRPVWLGLGAVAFDLLLALVATSLLRARVGLRAWRAVHWLAYASWPVALLHALGTGSDARRGWLDLLARSRSARSSLAVLWRSSRRARRPAAVRARRGRPRSPSRRRSSCGRPDGPLAAGWAAGPARRRPPRVARAGDDATVRARAGARSRRAVRGAAQRPGLESEPSLGRPRHGRPRRACGARRREGRAHVDLRGVPLEDGGVQMTASGVGFVPRRRDGA